MALDPALIQKLRQLAKCTPEVLAEQLTKLASADPDTWRQAINTVILTMWVKNMSTHSTAVEALKGVKVFQQMLESIAGGAQGAQEPQVPPGMPGRPAAPQVGGPLPPPQGGARIGGDGTPITDPTQLAAEEMMDQAMGLAPGAAAPQVPGRPAPAPQGPLPGRPRGGRNNHAIGVDGQPNTPEQQEAERILDEATGVA
jgi:hypothetical protein